MYGARLIACMALVVAFTVGVAYAEDLKKGKELFNDPGIGTNNKSCNSCHPDGKNIDGGKKTFKILGRDLNSLEDAVNFCIEKAMAGKPLQINSEEMNNIVSYIKDKKKKRSAPGY